MFIRLTRGQIAFDAGIALVYFVVCFAPLNRNDQVAEAITVAALAIALGLRRFSPRIALGVAWLAAVWQMYFAQIGAIVPDLAILAILYANARHADRVTRWFGFASIFVGAVLGVALIAMKKMTREQPIPYGVFLALGAAFAIFAGPEILPWFTRIH